ncbi:hypothetical protein FACS1894132_06810 [Clostridia bacterium]|nr:hypothetical protein FACS1894132_06810 [Clostridia bacterium]
MTLYAYIWAITGVATMYNLMNRTANRLIEKPLILFGEFSLDIYCIHMFLVRDFVFIPKFILQSNALIEAIYATIYGIGVCFIIAFLVKNFLRKIFLYRILFSGVK